MSHHTTVEREVKERVIQLSKSGKHASQIFRTLKIEFVNVNSRKLSAWIGDLIDDPNAVS